MQLLLSRKQSQGFSGVTFELWAKFDLTEDEDELIKKYQVRNAVISPGNTRRDMRFAALYALPVLLVGYFLFVQTYGMAGTILATLLCYGIVASLIYNQIREKIKISDIIEGRSFSCRSVITLLEKEAMLVDMAVQFDVS